MQVVGGVGRAGAERAGIIIWLMASTGLSRARQFGTLIGLLVLSAVLWALTPYFLTVSNLLNVAQQTSINAIVAAGMTFVILSGGIDLSVGSIVALSGVVLGTLLKQGYPAPVAITAALAVGLMCGLVNGTVREPGRPSTIHRDARHDERGPRCGARLHRRPAGVRLRRRLPRPGDGDARVHSGPGRHDDCGVHCGPPGAHADHLRPLRNAIGGNEEATRLSGVPVGLHKACIYGVCGLMSAVAAVILTARLDSAQPIAGMMS